MTRKARTIISIYAVAAIVTLGLLSAVLYERLTDYRRAALYSSQQAFEETVGAVDALSAALEKSLYAVDGGMCGKVCAEAFGRAMAAETALSVLPFNTWELERSAAFLNVAGDYSYSLLVSAGEKGFDERQLEQLQKLSAAAAEYSAMLSDLRLSLNNGMTVMDSMESPLRNVGESDTAKLSAAMLDYEASLSEPEPLSYDGRFTASEPRSGGELTPEEMLSAAARAAGVEERELKEEYDYEGEDGRRCYSAGELLVLVSSRGLESMAQSRLISEGRISADRAAEIAQSFLNDNGFEGLTQVSRSENGGTARFDFASAQDGALRVDDRVSVAIALDDGGVYLFDASRYSGEESDVKWTVDESSAREKLSDGLELLSARRVIIASAGGRDTACYEFTCLDEGDRQVRIYVDAETGSQCRIEL